MPVDEVAPELVSFPCLCLSFADHISSRSSSFPLNNGQRYPMRGASLKLSLDTNATHPGTPKLSLDTGKVKPTPALSCASAEHFTLGAFSPTTSAVRHL